MTENKHGFQPKQEITVGGIAWTVIQTGADWVKCISSKCVEERAFDEGNKNDFAASSLRAYLNGDFFRRLIEASVPEEIFEYLFINLTTDDGLKNYGYDQCEIGLITCEEYRFLRKNIPALPDTWWWTATADSYENSFARYVCADGCIGTNDTDILLSYLKREESNKQRQERAKAVDMMKHIAAAWDIEAEEVFGRGNK